MQQPEKHQPRVTFALPPPSPSPPPQELQQQKQPTPQSSSKQKRAERKAVEGKRQARPPPTLTAAQLIAHAAGPPTTGGSIKHAPQSPRGSSASTASSASSTSWTVSYPRLRRVPDKKPLPAVDPYTSWPGVIGYQRLPSCYDSPGEVGPSSAGVVRLLGATHFGPASVTSSSATPRVSNSTLLILDGAGATRSTTPTPRSRSSGTNPHRGATRKQPWTWSWTPGAVTSPIYDPDYADGPPECLAPRPTLPSSTSAAASLDADTKRTGRSASTKRLRRGEATPPNQVEQDDTRSNVSGSSSAGSYASSADSSQLFVTEVGGVGIMGTVESIWGEQLSEFRTLRI